MLVKYSLICDEKMSFPKDRMTIWKEIYGDKEDITYQPEKDGYCVTNIRESI